MNSAVKLVTLLGALLSISSFIEAKHCRSGRSRHHHSSHRHGYRNYRGSWGPSFYGGYYDPYFYDYGYGYGPYAYEPVGCSFGFNFFLG